MNPFERKFKEFAKTLSEKNADHHAADVGGQSQEVFRDKPFSEEFKPVYKVSGWGQSLSQIVTYCTTAALGVFALSHVIPLSWGIYIAVPLALLFAFGVELVKRSTLAIAAKHLLKYKTFGFVGFVAAAVMSVSIAAALYGAKELPGVFYPLPDRTTDPATVAALSADIDRVQADIERLQKNLKGGSNWTAENRTLPNLQRQRAALIERRDQATKEAATRGDQVHAAALADRAVKVDKMQIYSVGAAIIAELIFLLCTVFIFYYLFRHYAEQNPDAADESDQVLQTQPPTLTTKAQLNGRPVTTHNLRASTPATMYTTPADTPARAHDNATVMQDHFNKECAQCGGPFLAKVAWQKFCCEGCKLAYHEAKHGQPFDRGKAKYKRKATA